MGYSLQNKSYNDIELLNEVKAINKTIHQSAINQGQMSVEITNMKDDIKDIKSRMTKLELR